ncbi:germination protein M [Pelagirhabdus alkalitolerans]|uniref:Germination protein M n=1 Tax=Pelagirhabdus alkalitolerans TaxID=1612202 RepID=A0A1G6HM39_9BACI|nr:GerMN domain-containing protein [Pelagirhabdus alkalitolerans]SDB95291.1 germination protein M [Pelagirhabdus alkalitolerans]
MYCEKRTKRTIGFIMIILVSFLVIGCTRSQSTNSEDDSKVNDESYETNDEQEETTSREIYLLSESGLVVPQVIDMPQAQSNEVALQTLHYLIKDGPVTEQLPNGFEAVLPAGTEVLGLNLEEDGTLVIDLNEHFIEYDGDKEEQLLQALTYSLTQFDNVERIKLWVNSQELTEMPINQTSLVGGYSRDRGINLVQTDGIDLLESESMTVYYPTDIHSQIVHVPVTKRVNMSEKSLDEALVESLLEGPAYDIPLLHVFNPNVELLDVDFLTDGDIALTFNDAILSDYEMNLIGDEVMETLVLSLTEQPHISSVSIVVDGVDQVFNRHGVPYDQPVTRSALNDKNAS